MAFVIVNGLIWSACNTQYAFPWFWLQWNFHLPMVTSSSVTLVDPLEPISMRHIGWVCSYARSLKHSKTECLYAFSGETKYWTL